MNFMWRKPRGERKKPGPKPHGMSATSLWRRKHTAGLARSGYLDELTEELIGLIRTKANNVYLRELWRVRDRDIKLLNGERLMKVSAAFGMQKAKNEEMRRKYLKTGQSPHGI